MAGGYIPKVQFRERAGRSPGVKPGPVGSVAKGFFDDPIDYFRRSWDMCADDDELENDVRELIRALEWTERALQLAQRASEFTRRGADAIRRLREIRVGVRRLLRELSRGVSICSRIRSLNQVVEAARRLNQLRDFSGSRGEEAADAFGELFVGLGELMEMLPPPFDAYADFLQGARDFFTDMRRAFDLSTRPNTRRTWQELQDPNNNGGTDRRGM